MKRLFLSLAIIASISLTASVSAQGGKRDGKRRADFQKELNLTAEQKEKVESTNKDFKVKMAELKAKSDMSKEDKLAKVKELRTQHQTAVNNILTPEQQTKMKELRAKKGNRDMRKGSKELGMRGKKEGCNKDMRVDKRSDRMKDLNLTDEQKQRIKALNEDFREKSRELAKQHREELNKVYTPEQQTKLKEFRKDFNKESRFVFNGKRRMSKLDEAGKTKLKSLRENFEKEKKDVELSHIAPDTQKQN
jgi:Spy/CpxP family protein refolding chaperone